jgi:hypothetical protein
LYAYGLNNPSRYVDTDGLDVKERVWGGVKLIGGVVEAAAGAALGAATSWTGVGAVAGGFVFVHGADVAATGLRQLISGQPESSLTSQGLQAAGVSPQTAELLDTGLSVVGSAGAGLAATLPRAQSALTSAGPRTFASSDPLVGNLANKIEAAYPGHVIGVNVPVRNSAGQLITDVDILCKNCALQVKSGGGKGLMSQLQVTEQATGLPTIGYGPTLKPSVVKGIQNAGGLVTRDEALLIEVVKP